MTAVASAPRAELVRRGLVLAYLTIAWNVIEGIVAVTASGRAALLQLGIESFAECGSAAIIVWRLRAEGSMTAQTAIPALDEKARKLVALSLFVLAAFVAFYAIQALSLHEPPKTSAIGTALAVTSVVILITLALSKKRVAQALESKALEVDAFQTLATWMLSLVALADILLGGVLRWSAVAALVLTIFIVREGRKAWQGPQDCCL